MTPRVFALALCLLSAPALAAGQRTAQTGRSPTPPGQQTQTVSGCAMVAGAPPAMRLAALASPAPARGEVRITFIGHATFEIETPAGVRAATDYNDSIRPARTPDIATMNKAHSTHNSRHPDADIKRLLPGWNPAGGVARHDVTERDLRVRNIATNIRGWGEATEYGANSIFVFEAAGLCIAHLGHLHHTLDPDKLAELGRVDVLMVPVDGSWTMDQHGMLEVIEAIRAPLILPMHFFSGAALDRFIARLGDRVIVRRSDTPSITVSRATLPEKPTLVALPGRHF